MDFTEIYIKMSDHPKIQEYSPIKDDSGFHYRKDNIYIVDGDYYERHLIDVVHGKASYPIWLPCQDDIQKMMNFETYQVGSFSGYVHDSDPEKWYQFKTMEQLWLAFYMHEKHNLIWDGDKWIKGGLE